MIKIKKMHIVCLLEYFMIICMIFGSNSMLERDQRYNISVSIFYLAFSFMCMLLVFVNGIKKIKRIDLYKLLTVTGIAMLCIIVPHSDMSRGFIQWILPIFACSFYMIVNKNLTNTWRKYVNVMIVLSIESLFFYIGGTVLGIIKPTGRAYFMYDSVLKTCNSYYGIYYEAQKTQFFSVMFNYRNCGMFIESPIYNALLCLALSAEISLNRFKRKWVILLLAITILSTWSTTGLLFLVTIIALRLYIGKNSLRKAESRLLIIPIILSVAIYAAITLINNKAQSLSGEASLGIRVDHFIAFLKMWLNRPLFGYSYSYLDTFFKYTKYQVGYSVGLPALLGRSGIFMFMVYAIPWGKNTYVAFKKTDSSLYYWIGSFVIFFMTAIVYEPIFIFSLSAQLLSLIHI